MFDRVKNGISTIENSREISADRVIELLGCVIDDAVTQNSLGELAELQVTIPEDFLLELYSVLSAVSKLYSVNKKLVPQVGGILAGEFPVREKEIQEYKKELGDISAKIERLKEKNREKAAERDKLAASLDHLHNLEAKNKELEARIAELKTSISKFDENKAKLEEDYNRMNAKLLTCVNIWNGVYNQQFLKDALFADTALREIQDYPRWFADLEKIIADNVSEYQKELQRVIRLSEELTKEDKKE